MRFELHRGTRLLSDQRAVWVNFSTPLAIQRISPLRVQIKSNQNKSIKSNQSKTRGKGVSFCICHTRAYTYTNNGYANVYAS